MTGFRTFTRVHIAPGCLSRLPASARFLGLRRVLLVTDRGLGATPWPARVHDLLVAAGLHTETFDEIEDNPTTATVMRAAQLAREKEIEGLVGLGGGSVLDAAKATAMLIPNGGRIEHYEGEGRYSHRPLPYIAVPTTCGTGAEVTWVAVLNHKPTEAKISIKGDAMFPEEALVDADLLRTLPPKRVAWTGLDAFTHALEATTCQAANPISDTMAEKAIGLLFRYLPRAWANVAGDAEAREAVMCASTLAGLAFGSADVAAVHCLSESIGGFYDLPHGLLNAVLLVPVMRYHGDAIVLRLAALEAQVFPHDGPEAPPAERAERFVGRIEELIRKLEIPAFAALGIDPEDYHRIAEGALRNGSNGSNPQPMATSNYREILDRLRP